MRAMRRTSTVLMIAWTFMAADIVALILTFAGRS
jgi:hypothetical protein